MTPDLAPISLTKPPILLSQCLLGDPVRYDGAHKQHAPIVQLLLPHIAATALCPEMAAGMGVPRPAIRRQSMAGADIIALAESGQPLSNQLEVTCHKLAASEPAHTAVAAILKARSPSCGIQSSPLFNHQGDILTLGDGLWVQQLRQHQARLLLVSEEQLHNAQSCVYFLRLCQLALALRLKLLTEEWLAYLNEANAMHQLPALGLGEIARNLSGESAELHYLEPLPFVLQR
ncbi:DUF523 domain-containing protein [Simiduia curdlanivorans]|uniref:DUF523 domain-containing protein n=1 Tax=Simiduia curdlanivorans TaxID=1492769 RepID=A0ABV8V2V8_9GAMM|nr:DUF523 domain-containing protein [Simiduia curdlanivorans]MDN3637864.1 DUF523 domain-containing protein [Simiduia curdlanivorans]